MQKLNIFSLLHIYVAGGVSSAISEHGQLGGGGGKLGGSAPLLLVERRQGAAGARGGGGGAGRMAHNAAR